jgi:hypothetical protein
LPIILLQIPKFIEEGLLPLPTSTKDGPINIPGLPPFSAFDLPRDLIGDESSPNYKFYTRNTLRLGDATCILVNTFYELEKNVFDVVESEILNSSMQVCCLRRQRMTGTGRRWKAGRLEVLFCNPDCHKIVKKFDLWGFRTYAKNVGNREHQQRMFFEYLMSQYPYRSNTSSSLLGSGIKGECIFLELNVHSAKRRAQSGHSPFL